MYFVWEVYISMIVLVVMFLTDGIILGVVFVFVIGLVVVVCKVVFVDYVIGYFWVVVVVVVFLI